MTSLFINNVKVQNTTDANNTVTADINKDLDNNPNLLGLNSTIKIGESCNNDCGLNKCCFKYSLDSVISDSNDQVKWNMANMTAASHNLGFTITTKNFPAYQPTVGNTKVGTSIQLLASNGLGRLMTLTTGNGKFQQDGANVSFGNQFTTGNNLSHIDIHIENYYGITTNIMPSHIIGLSNDSFSFVPATDGIKTPISDPESKELFSDNYLTTGTRSSLTTQFLYQTFNSADSSGKPKITSVTSAQLHDTQTTNRWYGLMDNNPKTIQLNAGIDGMYVPDNYSDTASPTSNTIWPGGNNYTIFANDSTATTDNFCLNCVLKPNASTTFCVADDTSTPDKSTTALPRLMTDNKLTVSGKLEELKKWTLSVKNMHSEDILGNSLFAVRKFDAFPMLSIVYLKSKTLYGSLPGTNGGKQILPVNYMTSNTSDVDIYTNSTFTFTSPQSVIYTIPSGIDAVYVVMVNSIAFKWKYYGSLNNTSWELLYLPPNPNTMNSGSIDTGVLVADSTAEGKTVQTYYQGMTYASLTTKKYRLFRKADLKQWWFVVSTFEDNSVKDNLIYKSNTDYSFVTPYNYFYDNSSNKVTTNLSWVYGPDASKFIQGATLNSAINPTEFVTTSVFQFEKVTSS